MESKQNTIWGQSVAGIIINEDKVLLVRHTYGAGKGMLIIPGGYVESNETPQDAVKREVLEETGVVVEPLDVVAIRFNMHDWYVVFSANYITGEAQSDNTENSEAIWVDINEAISRDDVSELTKKLLTGVTHKNEKVLKNIPYNGNTKYAPYSLYGIE